MSRPARTIHCRRPAANPTTAAAFFSYFETIPDCEPPLAAPRALAERG